MTVPRTSRLSRERPFPGLRPFSQDDHDYFFGREDQTYSLYRLIDRSRFVAVVGSSGSGKSSLVRAGLLPLVEEETRGKGGRTWLQAEMRPGDAPLKNLAAALMSALTEDDAIDGLSAEKRKIVAAANRERIVYRLQYSTLADAIAEVNELGKRSVLLVVDQFEELFRYAGALASQTRELVDEARSRDEASRFVELLLEASRSRDTDVTVLLTMRSDFIGECARFHDLPEAVSGSQYLVPSLTRDQLEEVICHPVKKAGATIDRVLVERLLNDAGDDPDQLPVLQHCLLRIWEAAGRNPGSVAESQAGEPPDDPSSAPPPGRHLTIAQYDAIGRMNGAMSKHADEIMSRLPGLTREIELTFRSLSELDREGRAIRRALKFEALRAETGADESKLRDVIDRFREDDCSFLTPAKSAVERIECGTTIDVGHEALLRRWEKLNGEPGATGDRSDKRDIGWLRREAWDGRRYQALLSIADSAPDGKAVPSDYSSWWSARKPTEAWAKRYGGDFNRVEELLRRSKARRKATVAWGAAGAAAFVIFVLSEIYMLYADYQDRAALSVALNITDDQLLKRIMDSLSSGKITVAGAQDLAETLSDIVTRVARNRQTPQTRALRIRLMLTRFDIYYTLGKNDQARKVGHDAKDAAQQLVDSDSNNIDWLALLFETTLRIGDVTPTADWNDALDQYRSAQAIAQRLVDKSPENSNFQDDLMTIEYKIGEAYQAGGKLTEAFTHFNAALAIAQAFADKHPKNPEWQVKIAVTQTKIGTARLQQSKPDYAAALTNFEAAIAIQADLARNGNDDGDIVWSHLATSYRSKADALAGLGNLKDAFDAYEMAISIRLMLFNKDKESAVWMQYLATDYDHYGDALKKGGRLSDALTAYKQELPLRQKLAAQDPASAVATAGPGKVQKKIDDLQASLQPATNGASR